METDLYTVFYAPGTAPLKYRPVVAVAFQGTIVWSQVPMGHLQHAFAWHITPTANRKWLAIGQKLAAKGQNR
jgi:hypothetical protein